MIRYTVSPEAKQDLDEIWGYIARDSVDAAERWIKRLLREFELLAENPGIGHRRSDLTDQSVLFWPVGDYLVIYRRLPERIEVVAITQGARDVPRLLTDRG